MKASLKEGEEKRQEAINRFDAIKGVLPKAKQAELEENRKLMEKSWQNLIQSINQTELVKFNLLFKLPLEFYFVIMLKVYIF